MKLLIVSDSHGSISEINEIEKKYKNEVDAMIHCGDSELSAQSEELQQMLSVRGNCDFDRNLPLDIVEEIQGYKIFVTHGHHYNVKMTLMNLSYKAKEVDADFVFFGHSHIIGAEVIDGTLFLNPGSISAPRGIIHKTYAIVERTGNKMRVSFYTNTHAELTEYTQTFVL